MAFDSNEEDKLFKEIQDKGDYNYFVRDGVVNRTEYLKSKPKILFILRESYGTDDSQPEEIVKLREFFATGGLNKKSPQTESGITRTVEQIDAASKGKLLSYDETMHVDNERRKKALNKVAIFNLNKESNHINNQTNWTLLKKETKSNCDIYKKLFDLYEPDIIVCGGTYGLFQTIYPELEDTPTKDNRYYSWTTVNNKKTLVLNCNHPSDRNSHEYYDRLNGILSKVYIED
ncbi:hypothetical protein [Companilactobacillus futsaii]|uniref:Uracil-DNA glycosylase-like domain-containing protein n=2 Tax=Companilactobacillus futsaii TaxID=938155 RepID=A0A5B7T2H9_9LACO|nr:hypothetical protein [Companilactobacillus futsaii]KRK91411.1 hypothetical protein FC88_GL001212 [Companilactobacillus futsaii JCM 17355]QCX24552.1 hypothetical protein FG051_05265 [Companilactobacillus futsaii]